MIKALGINDNHLPFPQFQSLFINECSSLGIPVDVRGNNLILAAFIKPR